MYQENTILKLVYKIEQNLGSEFIVPVIETTCGVKQAWLSSEAGSPG